MRKIVAAACLLCSLPALGATLTVESLDFMGPSVKGVPTIQPDLKIPYVRANDAAHSVSAAKINDLLYIDLFGNLAPRRAPKYFTSADDLDVTQSGSRTALETDSSLDGQLLMIELSGEGCGAYCEDYQLYYSFDVRTGRRVTAGDLLTSAGLAELVYRVRQRALDLYTAQVTQLRHRLKKLSTQPQSDSVKDETQDVNDRIDMNLHCAGGAGPQTAQRPTPSEALQQFSNLSYQISETGIEVIAGRCSNHAEHALDDVGDVHDTVTFSALKPYLTDFGQAFIQHRQAIPPHAGRYDHLLYGRIGRTLAITMLLHATPDSGGTAITGSYFYDKFRKRIELTGQQHGTEMDLTEAPDGQNQAGPTIHLSARDGKISGTWNDKGKHLAVELAP